MKPLWIVYNNKLLDGDTQGIIFKNGDGKMDTIEEFAHTLLLLGAFCDVFSISCNNCFHIYTSLYLYLNLINKLSS